MLQLERASAGYEGSSVLFGVDLGLNRGSVVALLGPNGAGKTTLLRALSGLVKLSEGRLLLDGNDVSKNSPSQLARMGICHIPEGRGIFPSLSVLENLLVFANTNDKDHVRAEAITAFSQLEPLLGRTAGTLSGGQQQMLALTRSYLSAPAFVILDEVSMGLAPIVVDQIYEFLPKLAARGAGILLVEQYVAQALSLADTAYVLGKGHVVFKGKPAELMDDAALFDRYLGSESKPAVE